MPKIDKHTDFFAYVDNFARYKHIESIKLLGEHKKSPPKVSITIPTYRRPQLLKEAVESAINQINYSDYEIIIVDNDASGEFSEELIQILKSFNSDKIIYYRNQENIGMFGNWNRCIELATGEWMTILNDDDILAKQYLFEMTYVINQKTIPIDRLECLPTVFTDKHPDFDNIRNSIKMDVYLNLLNCFKLGCIPDNIFKLHFIRYLLGNRSLCLHANLFLTGNATSLGGFNPDFYPFADFCFNAKYHYFFNCYQLREVLVGYRWAVNESLNPRVIKLQLIGYNHFGKYLTCLNINQVVSICIYNVTRVKYYCDCFGNKKNHLYLKIYNKLSRVFF